MSAEQLDLAIVGGGLAGGLIALAVHRAHPGLRLALIEAGPTARIFEQPEQRETRQYIAGQRG